MSADFKILVVDDDKDTAISTKMLLERLGFTVDIFFNPKDVLSVFKSGVYDLALIDVKMNDMDGFHLYERMAAMDEKIKVCFMTAYDFARMKEVQKYQNKVPVDCFIGKPISSSQLVDIIKRQLERK